MTEIEDRYERCGKCGGRGTLAVFSDSRQDAPDAEDECRRCFGIGWVAKESEVAS